MSHEPTMRVVDQNAPTDSRPGHTTPRSTLDAAEIILRQAKRPLHARELACEIVKSGLARLHGLTPWKTVNARLSEDILRFSETSRFMRTAHGHFALRGEATEQEFSAKRRQLNPIDETIKVVPRAAFLEAVNGSPYHRGLYGCRYGTLLDLSIDMPRREAEETEQFVQVIPTFVVRVQCRVLTYTRTKRLPEARLHNARCVNFGGHMQSDDPVPLFRGEQRVVRDSLLRELHEELAFTSPPDLDYLGILHLRDTAFERQHAGVVFDVSVPDGALIESLEPGMHTDLRFVDLKDLVRNHDMYDSWSRTLIRAMHEQIG